MNEKNKPKTHWQPSSSAIRNELNKQMPKDTNIEEAVLGALLLEKDAINEVIDILKVETFYEDKHQKIYEAILSLFNKLTPVDLATVSYELRTMGVFEFIGGAYGLAKLTQNVNSAANIVYHSRILQEMSMKRDLIRIGGDVQKNAFEDTTDVFDLMDETEQKLFDLQNFDTQKPTYEAVDAIRALEESMEEAMAEGIQGVATGYPSIDNLMNGLRESEFIVIAGRPAMGKTSLAHCIALNAINFENTYVILFSLEMNLKEVSKKIASISTEIPFQKIDKPRLLNDNERLKVEKFKYEFSKKNSFLVNDATEMTVLNIQSIVRRQILRIKREGIGQNQRTKQSVLEKKILVIVDYIQIVQPRDKSKTKIEAEKISEVCRDLKNMAEKLKVPVIGLAQLKRTNDGNSSSIKKPTMADIKGSGGIEEAANIILAIHRPEYYGQMIDEAGEPTNGLALIMIMKSRRFRTGIELKMQFIDECTAFKEDGMVNSFQALNKAQSEFLQEENQKTTSESAEGSGYDFNITYDAPCF